MEDAAADNKRKQELFNLWREWPYILIIIIAVLISMNDFVFGGKDFGADGWKSQHPWTEEYELKEIRSLSWDCELQHRPWFEFARTELLNGRLPLWNPYSFVGYPLYANHLVPVLYPPLTISLLLFEDDNIAGVLMILHLIIYGISLYLLLRVLGVKPWAAMLTSSATQFTGICFALWLPWGAAISWMPGILACYELYRRTRRLKYLAWGGLLYGVWFMAAYPLIGVHFTYFLAAYIILRELTGKGGRPIAIIPALLSILVIGALISGIQNIPTHIYSKDTYRSMKYKHGIAYVDPVIPETELVPEDPFPPPFQAAVRNKGRYLAPVSSLRIDYNRMFAGLPIFLLGVFGLFVLPRGIAYWRWLFIVLLGLSFWDPLFRLALNNLPFWNMNIYPPREIWHITLMVCAAYGLQGMFEGTGRTLAVPVKGLLSLFAIGCLAFVGLIILIEMKVAPVLYTMNQSTIVTTGLLYFLSAFAFVCMFFISLRSKWNRLTLFAGLFAALILIGGIPARMYALPYQSNIPVFSPDKSEFFDAVKDATSADKRLARITSKIYYTNILRRQRAPFITNLTTKYRIMDVSGYDSLIPKRNVEYLNLVENFSVRNLHIHISFNDPEVVNADLFRALAIGCVLSDMPELPIATEVTYAGGMYIHKIPNPAPRYYAAHQVEFVNGSDEMKERLRKNDWVDERIAVIDSTTLTEEEIQKLKSIPIAAIAAPQIIKTYETPGSISFDIETDSPALLVLNDAYAEGWEVFIDGHETRCLNVNFLFKAAYVPEGNHTVTFSYQPESITFGLVASLLGVLIFLMMLLLDIRLNRSSRE